MPAPCSAGRPWCQCSDVPPVVCAQITKVFAGGGAWKPTDWMLQLLGFKLPLRLVRCDLATGTVVWYGCASIPPGIKNLGVRMFGGIQAVLRTSCPGSTRDFRFRWYCFPSAHNPAPEIVDPLEGDDGASPVSFSCGPPLVGKWSLLWAEWTLAEGPCPIPPIAGMGYWTAYAPPAYFGPGYWESYGSGPPPPGLAGYWGGYSPADYFGPGYF